ncbi:MAG: alpha/beta hydrolase-fold protein [Planctomycetota bacterium]
MRSFFVLCVLVLAVTTRAEVEQHKVPSAAFDAERTVRVWSPPAGVEPAGVLLMHDAQNLFDPKSASFGVAWEVDETMARLVGDGTVPPLLVVGIDHGGKQRIAELTHEPDPSFNGGGRGETYATFVLDELVPWVEATFDVTCDPATTYIGGSSLGGLMSLQLAHDHPGRFAGVIAMSPSLWWNDTALLDTIQADASAFEGVRVWLDVGTKEGRGVEVHIANLRRLARVFEAAGVAYDVMIDADHPNHNESAWAARFPAAVTFVTGDAAAR